MSETRAHSNDLRISNDLLDGRTSEGAPRPSFLDAAEDDVGVVTAKAPPGRPAEPHRAAARVEHEDDRPRADAGRRSGGAPVPLPVRQRARIDDRHEELAR